MSIYMTLHLITKICQMAANSWKEISTNIGVDVPKCTRRWKKTERQVCSAPQENGNEEWGPRCQKSACLFFLHVLKHWDTESNYNDNQHRVQLNCERHSC